MPLVCLWTKNFHPWHAANSCVSFSILFAGKGGRVVLGEITILLWSMDVIPLAHLDILLLGQTPEDSEDKERPERDVISRTFLDIRKAIKYQCQELGRLPPNVYKQQFSLINAHNHITGDNAFKRMKDQTHILDLTQA